MYEIKTEDGYEDFSKDYLILAIILLSQNNMLIQTTQLDVR